MAGHVTLTEIMDGTATLDVLLTINSLMDAEIAQEHAAAAEAARKG